MAPDKLINDPWRNLRRGPAWISFIGSFAVVVPSLPYAILNATDGNPATGSDIALITWFVGAVVVLASVPFGILLLRTEDRRRQVRLGLITFGLWLLGVLVIAGGNAWGSS
jgi:peptidoglycan/LPS O-acetylase OafA/YrhL